MSRSLSARLLARLLLPIALVALLGANPGTIRAQARPPAGGRVSELRPVLISGRQLTVGGEPFEVRGVNYIRPSGSAAICPDLHFGAAAGCPWDMTAIDADMDLLQTLGVNTIRIFLDYYIFGGARAADPAYSMRRPLAQLDALIDSANRRGMYVIPVLLAKYPQHRFTVEGLALARELHVAPVARHLAHRPGVLALDLFNEPDIGSPIDERCWDWDNALFPSCTLLAERRIAFLTQLYYEVKWYAPERLTTLSMAFAKSYFRPTAITSPLAGLVDFYAFHYYDDDPVDCGRYAQHWYYGEGLAHDLRRAIVELHALGRDKPVVVTEIGFPSGDGARRGEPELRRDMRFALAAAREAGAAGLMLWPFQDGPEALVADLFAAP